ncbi:unnamed protein product [Prorocentrum cordatum]|uniref:Uncharacterized protein n=1 Tax=Prorocentrum cordatum TaxID=2364126 RepID=A0ABN9WJJ4_9DINO|nr:unnamed protein product [Polarella glacialis]
MPWSPRVARISHAHGPLGRRLSPPPRGGEGRRWRQVRAVHVRGEDLRGARLGRGVESGPLHRACELPAGGLLAGEVRAVDGGLDYVCFDSEGFIAFAKTKRKFTHKFNREETVAVLLNLDAGSPNANTISLFRNGKRATEPQALPEFLLGKTLYPAVTYKNVSLQVNLGPWPFSPLPFKCTMLAEAAADDVEVAPSSPDQGEKAEVVMPIGLPDTGYFDWVDHFLSKGKEYEELSDRRVIDLATKSGLWRPGAPNMVQGSNDKPEMRFNVPSIDDHSVRRMLYHLAQTSKRSFIVPELAGNLQQAERKKMLANFSSPAFTKTAVVLMGEPSEEHKARVQALILDEKQAAINAEHKAKVMEATRKKMVEERKRKLDEAKKAREAAARKEKGEDGAEGDAEEAAPAPEEDPMDVDPPAAELTEEEKKVSVRKSLLPDLTDQALKSSYSDFSLPSTAEGFDQIKYVWQTEEDCARILREWILAKKMVQRVDGLQPGAEFRAAWADWQKELTKLKALHELWRGPCEEESSAGQEKGGGQEGGG